jgi:intraflagellar transport protein 88
MLRTPCHVPDSACTPCACACRCAEQLRSEGHTRLANEVELAKASKFLSNKEFEAAVAVFKEFEKKEPRVKARAATNLAFLYVLEGNRDSADKYSDLALSSDRYNARAFVNKVRRGAFAMLLPA